MAMENGHALDHRVGEIHNNVDSAGVRDIHGVQPYRISDRLIVFSKRKKMDLMNVHRMQFARGINNSPMLKGSDLYVQHWVCIGREFLTVYVKTVLVLGKGDDKLRW